MKCIIPMYLRIQEAKEKLQSMVKNEEGATMVEYALMVALIAAAAITVVQALSGSLNGVFTSVSDKLTAAK